jgi:aldehyde dehydrogenase (NAD+)
VHGGPDVGEQLVNNPMVAGISFTGSTKVGMGIHAVAAKRLAKTQLEMDRKNPQVILGDADLDLAVDARIFPFDQIAEAHRFLESNEQFGKIVVTV